MLHFGPIQAVQRKIAQTRLEKMAELAAALVRSLQPTLPEDLVLSEFLQHDVGVIPQSGKRRYEEDLQRPPILADESIEAGFITLRRLAQRGPIRRGEN